MLWATSFHENRPADACQAMGKRSKRANTGGRTAKGGRRLCGKEVAAALSRLLPEDYEYTTIEVHNGNLENETFRTNTGGKNGSGSDRRRRRWAHLGAREGWQLHADRRQEQVH